MKKMIVVILTIWVTYAYSFCHAQTLNGTITGKALTANQNPIENANILLLNAIDSSIIVQKRSQKDGTFIFEGLRSGDYKIKITSVGFLPHNSETIKINEALNTIVLKFVLQLAYTDLKEVAIVSNKAFVEQKIDRTVVYVDAMISNAGTTSLDVLEKSPGIQVDQNGAISLKGQLGVVVFINDKPSYLSGADLQNYLRSLPSSMLDKIEIMTNPPAKYDASGSAGAINIKIKKKKAEGLNVGLNIGARQSKNLSSNNSMDFNYLRNKVNIFGNLGYTLRNSYNDINIYRTYKNEDGSIKSMFNQNSYIKKLGYGFKTSIGADYYASENTTFGVTLDGLLRYPETRNISKGSLLNSNGLLDSSNYSQNNEEGTFKNGAVNLNYRHQSKEKGSEITANLDYLRFDIDNIQNFTNQSYSKEGRLTSEDIISGNLPSNIQIYSAKTDFISPITKSLNLDAGLKSSYTNTNNVANYYNLLNGGSIPDYNRTNNFKYRENINAAYLNLNKRYKKLSVQAGLRLENTVSNGHQLGNSLRSDSSFKRTYTNLFPTVYFLYKLDSLGDHQLKLNYGRRIDRPYYQDLNPFITQLDKYTYYVGNPYLKPSFSGKVEMGYIYKNNFTATLSYSQTKDDGNETIEIVNGVYFSRPGNIGNIRVVNLSLSGGLEPLSWLSFQYNGSATLVHAKSAFYTGFLDSKGLSFFGQGLLQFKLGKGWTAQFDGNFQTQSKSTQFIIASRGVLNAGIAKNISPVATLKFSVSDLLYTNINRATINNLYLTEANFRTKGDSRAALLTFSLRLGKTASSQRKRNNSGADTEQGRVKN